MKKEELEKDLILGLTGNSIFQKYGHFQDANDVSLKTGMYGLNSAVVATTGLPPGANYGMMLVFNGEGMGSPGNPVVQVVVDRFANIWVRMKWYTSEFTAWKKVNLV